MSETLRGLFVTGTNTGVGKTRVTGMIARRMVELNLRIGAYKPVCSGSETTEEGNEFWPDVARLSAALGNRYPDDWICPQRFSAAVAPTTAAALEGRQVEARKLRTGLQRWAGEVDVVLVEGVGGWKCPLAERETVADLAAGFGFPVLVVVGLELGAINHTLLTVESVLRRECPLAGIVVNHHRPQTEPAVVESTIDGIREFADEKLLATIPHEKSDRLPPGHPVREIDWYELAGPQNVP